MVKPESRPYRYLPVGLCAKILCKIGGIGLRLGNAFGEGAGIGRGVAEPFAKAEMLDIQPDIKGQPLVIRPIVIGALNNGRIIVTAVFPEVHLCPIPILRI